MAYRPVPAVEVLAWDAVVGAIAVGDPGETVFAFDPRWIAGGRDLAPVLMPLSTAAGRRYTHRAARESETFRGLPPMLADSLPDLFGNALITRALQDEGVTQGEITAIDRLAYVGARGMGALTFRPATRTTRRRPTAIEMRELVEEARRVVAGDLSDAAARSESMQELIQVGTSAGGARPKAVIAWNRATGEVRAGNLPAPAGFEQWLLKFDGVNATQRSALGGAEPYTRTEYAYHLMARDAGITMSECELLEEGGRAHFVTRRFDRPVDGDRLHLQTICALSGLDYDLHGAHGYAGIFDTVRRVAGPQPSLMAEVFRRMAFNVLASNTDDHLKNHAMVMDATGHWALAPAYDLTYNYNPAATTWLRSHAVTVNGKGDGITAQDLLAVGSTFDVPDMRGILRQVQDAVGGWRRHAAAHGVPEDRIQRVEDRLREVRRIFGALPGARRAAVPAAES